LFLGAGSNLFPNAGVASQPLYPFNGQMQEVAFYNQDLTAIEGGLENILACRVVVGSNL
jgi:hypothetical protein